MVSQGSHPLLNIINLIAAKHQVCIKNITSGYQRKPKKKYQVPIECVVEANLSKCK